MVKERNVAVCVILSLVTCGIYGIVWFFRLNDDARTISGDQRLSGGKAFLLTIVTCGIYYFYWAYLMGKAINEANIKANKPANDNSTLYLILSILGLGIVTYALAQSEINKFATPAIQDAQQ